MADSTLDSELFWLFDKWPGVPRIMDPPTDGFTGSEHNNVAVPVFMVGEKRQVYNHAPSVGAGIDGSSTFIYLQVGTQNAMQDMVVKNVCVPGSATLWYQVSDNPDASIVQIGGAPCAIAIADMTDAYYGWFWCGGVCPEEYVSGLGGTYRTDGNLVAGPFCLHDLEADFIGFGPIDETTPTENAVSGD